MALLVAAAAPVAHAGEAALDPGQHGLAVDTDGCHKWQGVSHTHDEFFDAWLCTKGDQLTGWIKSDMPSYGWDRVTLEGTWSHDHKTLRMHDVKTLEQHSIEPGGRFCLIDDYDLVASQSGHLEGEFIGRRCHSGPGSLTLDIVRDVTESKPAPLPVEKPIAVAGCSLAPGTGRSSATVGTALALLVLLSSLGARRRSHRPA